MLSDLDLARYPFTLQTASLVESLGIKVDDLIDPAYREVLERARERVEEAIREGVVRADLRKPSIETLSYPIAIMFVKALGDRFLYRRYATAEAKRASKLLERELNAKILHFAREAFGWRIKANRGWDDERYPFLLHFKDYLRNASGFHEARWKLVNRAVRDGYVRITKVEAARLMESEVERRILEGLLTGGKIELPEPLRAYLRGIERVLEENRGRIGMEALPSEVVIEAFPPCIRRAYEGLISGRKASHMERFAITSFLINIGMDLERIVRLFVSVSDFDEKLTRYQVEHIAGLRGSRTKYTPPTCSTLRTHGLCINPDDLCRRIRHPLTYYRRKFRSMRREEWREGGQSPGEPAQSTSKSQ